MKQLLPRQGQAMVMLILVTVVLLSVTSLAVAMVVTNTYSITREEQGSHALEIAESGAEEGLLRILRDPTTTGSYTVTVDSGTASVTVVGVATKTITSRGAVGQHQRTLQVVATITSGQLVVNSWQEL